MLLLRSGRSVWEEGYVDWAIGMVTIVGIVVTIVAFLVGWVLINRRRARMRELAAQAGEWKEVTSPQDTFRYGMGMARRKSVRLSGNQIPVHVSPDGTLESAWEGWILDRSQGGLRLRVPEPIPVGVVLRVRCLNEPENLPWVEVQVKHTREKDQTWEIGCEFLAEPPGDVLQSFGVR
jgi:PilZ domain